MMDKYIKPKLGDNQEIGLDEESDQFMDFDDFDNFDELATSLNLLIKVLFNSNLAGLDQDTVDVFYINASSLNTSIQLESYIKKQLNKQG